MTAAGDVPRDFLAISRRLLDVLGADGLGDESDQRHFAVDGVEASWVAQPASIEQASAVLQICAEHDLAVVPAGLGYRLGHGLSPERVDLVLSTARLCGVIDHAAADLTLTVEAGATLGAIDRVLRPAGQWLPLDPPRPDETTVGGLIAAQATGPSRQKHGGPRESLLGVRALLADGTAIQSGGRVVKNVAGYDLQKLLVGSFGTLAIVVEATFKLAPLPSARRLLCFTAGDRGALARAAAAAADSVFEPEFLELLIEPGVVPVLAVGIAGTAEDVDAAAVGLAERFASLGAEPALEAIGDPELRARLASIQSGGEGIVVVRGAVRRDRLGAWLDGGLEALRPLASAVRAHAHAGIGVARLRIEGARQEELASPLARIREQARAEGGYLVVEHAPPAWKPGLDVWGEPGAGAELMAGIKAAFDPRRRLSPGRFVGGL